MKKLANDPAKAGQLVSRKTSFGEYSRYAVAPVHTRFDRFQWFVWDANVTDEVTGRPAVIRQSDSLEEAVEGLEGANRLSHMHLYRQHPSWETHMACGVCGFAAPKDVLR